MEHLLIAHLRIEKYNEKRLMFRINQNKKTKELDLRNKLSKLGLNSVSLSILEQIKDIINKACKNKEDIDVIDISENDFGEHITIKDFNNVLNFIAITFSNLNKLVLHGNKFYKWFENQEETNTLSELDSIKSLETLDISENGLFLSGLAKDSLSRIVNLFPSTLLSLDLTQTPDHPSTIRNYNPENEELIATIDLVKERCKFLQHMYFDKETEANFGLDGTGEFNSIQVRAEELRLLIQGSSPGGSPQI